MSYSLSHIYQDSAFNVGRLALLIVFGFIVALVSAEIILRLIPPTTKTSLRQYERPKNFYLPYDAATMRGNPGDSFNHQANSQTIAIIGDSFTFGPEMQYFDTFSFKLKLLFNTTNRGSDISVINYGTPGLSTHHEISFVKKAIEAGAKIILLEITLNDTQEESLKKIPDEFKNYLIFNYFNKIMSWSRLYRFIENRIINHLSIRRYIDYHNNLFNDPKALARFRDSLNQMKSLADSNQAIFAAVIFPLFDFHLNNNYPFSDIHHKIHQILRNEKIEYLDLRNRYKNVDPKRLQLSPGIDSHPNEIAHRIAAESIYEWLRHKKILPPEIFSSRI